MLNQYNGHSHGSFGFHYHLTAEMSGTPTFPYGPSLYYYGCGQCKTSQCGQATAAPVKSCVFTPSASPTKPSMSPTQIPTTTPTFSPTVSPSIVPSIYPSSVPTNRPTVGPTTAPTIYPSTLVPSRIPTYSPSITPTFSPSKLPSQLPTGQPTAGPTAKPTFTVTLLPTTLPTYYPTTSTKVPTKLPSVQPSVFPSISPTNSPTSIVDYSCLHYQSWLLNANNNNDVSAIFSASTDVVSSFGTAGSTNIWSVSSFQIPYYNTNFTVATINALNSRPLATSDFVSGVTTALTGKIYPFGADIGYSPGLCSLGYWPPGTSDCPYATSATSSFPLKPAPEISTSAKHT